MCKIVYEPLATLALTGKRLRAKANYSKQALQFYNAAIANANYTAVLAASNIDAAKLTAMQAGFTHLEALGKAQTAETGEAQEATAARDKAWDALETWISKFYKKARVALRKYPQLMEKIGLIEKS